MKATKQTTILFISLVLICKGFSQKTTFEKSILWGEKQLPVLTGHYVDIDIFKSENNITYYFSTNSLGDETTVYTKQYNYITRHNENTNQNSVIEIESNYFDNRFKLLYKYFENNSFHVYKSFVNKMHKKIYIFHETYDIQSFKLNDDIKMVSEVDFSKLRSIKDLNINIVRSSNFIIVSYEISRNTKQNVRFEIFDLKGDMQWSTIMNVDVLQKGGFQVKQVLADSMGNLYVLRQDYRDIDNPYISDMVISVFEKNGYKNSRVIKIDKSNNICKASFSINNNQLYCSGLFAKSGNMSALGSFSVRMDTSLKEASELNSHTFDLDFLMDGVSLEEQNTFKFRYLKGWDFDWGLDYGHSKIMFQKDGSYFYIIEKKAVLVKGYVRNNERVGGVDYLFRDIFVTYCNPDGIIRWVKKIPRDQRFSDYRNLLGSYFAYFDKNDQLNIMINNIDRHQSIIADNNSSKTQLFNFDNNGNFTSTDMINDKNIALQMVVRKSKIIDNMLFLTRYNFLTDLQLFTFKGNSITFGKTQLY